MPLEGLQLPPCCSNTNHNDRRRNACNACAGYPAARTCAAAGNQAARGVPHQRRYAAARLLLPLQPPRRDVGDRSAVAAIAKRGSVKHQASAVVCHRSHQAAVGLERHAHDARGGVKAGAAAASGAALTRARHVPEGEGGVRAACGCMRRQAAAVPICKEACATQVQGRLLSAP